jgi:hypothetical protein
MLVALLRCATADGHRALCLCRQYRCAAVHRVLRDREKAAAAAAASNTSSDSQAQQQSKYIFKHMHVFTRAGSSSSDITGSSSSNTTNGSAACARSDAAAAAAGDAPVHSGESQFGSSSGAAPFPLSTPVGWQEEEDREGAAVVAAR